MFSHPLFELLKTFTLDEINDLRLFLNSPYFNRSKKIYNLFNEIVKYYPFFNSDDLTKASLCLKINSKGSYVDSTLRDAMSDLLRLTLNFLAINSFQKKELDFNNYLLNELLNRNEYKLFEKKMKTLEKDLNQKEDSRYFYNKYWMETMRFNNMVLSNKILHKAGVRERAEQITKISEYLMKFFLTEISCLSLNLRTMAFQFNYEPNSLDYILENINIEKVLFSQNKNKNFRIISLYYILLKTFSNLSDEKQYFRYKRLIKEMATNLSKDEISFHYKWLVNYCILKKQIGKNKHDFDIELFKIYKNILNNRYFKDSKSSYLSNELYRDILLHGLNSKNYSFVWDFIQEYTNEIEPNNRMNILNYSYLYYYFYLGNYQKSLEYYNKVKIDNFIFKYDIKNLVLKLYFELNYFEEALDEIRSYREFLRTNDLVSVNKKLRYGNFLKYISKLILYNAGQKNIDLGYLYSQLNKEQNVSHKQWLLERYSASITNIKKVI